MEGMLPKGPTQSSYKKKYFVVFCWYLWRGGKKYADKTVKVREGELGKY